MELGDAVRGRRMVRSFAPAAVAPEVLDRLLADALRAPTAGNSAGVAWLALEGADTATYWATTTTADWRAASRRWPGLSRAPVVALCLFSRAAYDERYAEEDKRRWGEGTASWPVDYWVGDAAFAAMVLLLGAHDAGLGACFLGNFRGEQPLLAALGVPAPWRLFGAVALGHPDGADPRSSSLRRQVAPRAARVHHGRWGGDR